MATSLAVCLLILESGGLLKYELNLNLDLNNLNLDLNLNQNLNNLNQILFKYDLNKPKPKPGERARWGRDRQQKGQEHLCKIFLCKYFCVKQGQENLCKLFLMESWVMFVIIVIR